ncbi:MAG TPA: hypothetical protein VI260_04865 [Blastocatellia bacterium]|jgi:hypothetical protein
MHDEHPQPEPFKAPLDTLLKKPSATIYLDGLMILCYDKNQKRLQAGIHTDATFHAMTINIRERGQSEELQSMCLEHKQIKEIAPFFLYVEKKEGSRTPNGSATLHKPDDPRYRQSFANVLDFQSESFHKRDRLRIKPNKLSPLNILNGEFYSATLGTAKRMNMECDPNPLNLGLIATRVAGDITHTSGNLILRSKDPKAKPLFRLPLSEEKHYEVTIVNEPTGALEVNADHIHDHSGDCAPHNGHPRTNHFNVYYEVLVLRDGAVRYAVEIVDEPRSTHPDTGPVILFEPDDPPCDIVWVSGIPQLP